MGRRVRVAAPGSRSAHAPRQQADTRSVKMEHGHTDGTDRAHKHIRGDVHHCVCAVLLCSSRLKEPCAHSGQSCQSSTIC